MLRAAGVHRHREPVVRCVARGYREHQVVLLPVAQAVRVHRVLLAELAAAGVLHASAKRSATVQVLVSRPSPAKFLTRVLMYGYWMKENLLYLKTTAVCKSLPKIPVKKPVYIRTLMRI